MCKIMFATQVAYRGHVEKHKDDVFYTCDFCDEAFTSEAALDRHVEEAHASYDCELCGEKFDVRRDLDRHATKKHGGAKLHHCEKCDRFFILKALMIGHQCQKRGEYYCQLCERDFTTNQGLQLHLRGHPADRARSATRRANCEVCHKELDACYMDKHMRTMHSKTVERPYGCEECGRRFTEVFHLKEHMESHKKRQFQCAECGASFSTKRYLEKHLKLGHVSKQRKPNRKPWTVECQLCSKVFTKASIDTHVAIKHSGKTPHVCLICGKAYATEAALAKHQDIHTKNYQCGTCGKRYASESEVVKHATLHQERSRLYCHICEKQFLREKNFNKHMETHGVSKQGKKKKGKGANTGSFQCIRCFRLFKNSRSLELHFRQHTGEKPYPCDRCKKRFAYPFALASHKKKEHADEESTSSEDTTGYENQDQPRDDVYLPDDDYPASYPATTTARHDVRRKQTFTSSAGNNVYYIANQAKTTYTGSTGYSPAKVSSVWSPPKTAGGSTLWNPARDTNRVLTPGVAGFAHDLRFGVPVDEAGWSNLQTTQVQTQQTYSNPPVAHTTSYIPQQTVQVRNARVGVCVCAGVRVPVYVCVHVCSCFSVGLRATDCQMKKSVPTALQSRAQASIPTRICVCVFVYVYVRVCVCVREQVSVNGIVVLVSGFTDIRFKSPSCFVFRRSSTTRLPRSLSCGTTGSGVWNSLRSAGLRPRTTTRTRATSSDPAPSAVHGPLLRGTSTTG